MRTAAVERRTAETKICLSVQLDEPKTPMVQTGLGFFDHMLILLGRHGFFGLQLEVQGDLEVDGHHTVEDTGICLGQALQQAMGDKAGIARYGTAFVPMDEALAMVSLDISGRPYLVFDAHLPVGKVGEFDLELVEEFLRALSVHAGLTLHVRLLSGKNAHHMVEAIFKALGRALADAMAKDSRVRGVLSTKGSLD
nr:imidazoleglycerol-phosphate dehydratase HisB [uncultured Anaeromusa sp.]